MNIEVAVGKHYPMVFHHSYQIIKRINIHTYVLKLNLLTLKEVFHSKYLRITNKGENTIIS